MYNKERRKERYLKNRERNLKTMREYYQKNKELPNFSAKKQEYRKTHRQQHCEDQKKYREKNKNKLTLAMRKYRENAYNRIVDRLRSRIHNVLSGKTKSGSTLKLIGCNKEFLLRSLEYDFLPGMSWDNYGEWHIDHIRPCASFDLSKPSEQRKCFNYRNLQPLWAKDNLSKGSKYSKGYDMKLEIDDVYLRNTIDTAATKLVGELCANLETISNADELKKTAKNTIYQNFRDLTAQIRAFDCGVKFIRPLANSK